MPHVSPDKHSRHYVQCPISGGRYRAVPISYSFIQDGTLGGTPEEIATKMYTGYTRQDDKGYTVECFEGLPPEAVLVVSFRLDQLLYLVFAHPDWDMVAQYDNIPCVNPVFHSKRS